MTSNNTEEGLYPKKEELSLKELILKIQQVGSYLVSRWKTILLVAFLCGLLGLAIGFISKPTYIANSTFVLEEGDGGGGMLSQYSGIASMVGIDVSGGGNGLFQGDNILELYKSHQMIRKALLSYAKKNGAQVLLLDRYFVISKLKDHKDIKKLDFTNQSNFSRQQDSVLENAIEDIKKNYLSVDKPDKKLSIIAVTVSSSDEFFSKCFNDQIVKTVNEFYIQTKTKKSLQNLTVLQHTADSVRAVLNNAISQTAQVSDATPNLNPNRQILRTPGQRSQFNAEANKAILGQIIQNLELAKISLRRETPLIQVIDTPVYPLKKEKFGKAKGAVLGGLIGIFICAAWLLTKRIFKSVMN